MRTLALVAALTALTAMVLVGTAPERPTTDATITSLTMPAEAFVDERLSVRGSVLLRSDAILDRRFRVCNLESGACTTTGWGSVTGQGHWAGHAGDVRVSDPGTYRLIWTLHAPWDSDTMRAASRAEVGVTVRAAPE